jgi:dipeptidyl aminopeptidase/acylaminoacyl peptidase
MRPEATSPPASAPDKVSGMTDVATPDRPLSASPAAPLPAVDQQARWVQRFRASRISLPSHAENRPEHCVLVSNASGTFEVYAWDRDSGDLRQATDRPNGTYGGAIDPSGEYIVWFADTDGDEFGVWMRQPFAGGADEPLVPGLEPAYSAGLAIADDGTVAVGRATDDGVTLHVVRPGTDPALVYAHRQDAHLGALSRDGRMLVIAHSEHGDSRHMALRALSLDAEGSATTVAELWDGEGLGLDPVDFAPVAGDDRLLVIHERHGRAQLLIWNPADGTEEELGIDLPGELDASWYPDGSALLVGHDYEARSELYRYDISTRELNRLETPRGVVIAAAVRPGGDVEFAWSSSEEPRVVRNLDGAVVLQAPGEPAPRSTPVTDAWVEGPGGRVHALVSTPSSGTGPYPAVFSVHGGPHALDTDSFDPDTASWLDQGYAVVRVNYRGSTGYGSGWRDALEGRVGLTELEDIVAVRDWAVESGLADPDRIILTGGSWGGYLTLLGLGRYPGKWSLGISIVPVADYLAAYEDEMEPLRAFDRAMFGGDPTQVPERWRESNPMTYVETVDVPVLILAGENDPRCPIRQIDNYLAALRDRSAAHEVYRYDAGHGSLVVDERVTHQAICLDFAARQLGVGAT